jgi:hypothetical protein
VKPEIAEVWALALESGLYDQGTGQLVKVTSDHLPRQYCCLGVLCDLANKAGVKASDDPEIKRYGWGFGTNGATLPECVIEWAGMATPSGMYGQRPEEDLLIARNDNGDSFAEIARIIRDHAEEL